MDRIKKVELTQRERKLKQGRDRVDELYAETHHMAELVYMNRHLIQGLPSWGESKLLKNAWTRGDTHYDVPGVYRYADTRTGEIIYYGMSVCSSRLRCNEQHSKTWCYRLGRSYTDLMNHVSVEYLPLPIEVASLVESALISNHYTKFGNLPLLNSSF